MIALVDTNVVLDLLLPRKDHLAQAELVFAASETGQVRGLLCATTLTTIHYLTAKTLGKTTSLQALRHLLNVFDVASVTKAVIVDALANTAFSDFEDAVLHAAAKANQAQAIVTRNVKDFHGADLPIFTPGEFIATLKQTDADQ